MGQWEYHKRQGSSSRKVSTSTSLSSLRFIGTLRLGMLMTRSTSFHTTVGTWMCACNYIAFWSTCKYTPFPYYRWNLCACMLGIYVSWLLSITVQSMKYSDCRVENVEHISHIWMFTRVQVRVCVSARGWIGLTFSGDLKKRWNCLILSVMLSTTLCEYIYPSQTYLLQSQG